MNLTLETFNYKPVTIAGLVLGLKGLLKLLSSKQPATLKSCLFSTWLECEVFLQKPGKWSLMKRVYVLDRMLYFTLGAV